MRANITVEELYNELRIVSLSYATELLHLLIEFSVALMDEEVDLGIKTINDSLQIEEHNAFAFFSNGTSFFRVLHNRFDNVA